MLRTQIQFTEEQMRKLKRIAQRRGQSLSAVVRDAVENEIRRASRPTADQRLAKASAVVGAFSSGRSDVSRDHDHHLDEAFGS